MSSDIGTLEHKMPMEGRAWWHSSVWMIHKGKDFNVQCKCDGCAAYLEAVAGTVHE